VLLELNSTLDRPALRAQFDATGRLQIRDVLTAASAERLRTLLASETPWGLAWQAGSDGPHLIRNAEIRAMGLTEKSELAGKLGSVGKDSYAFLYHSYPLVTAYLEKWNPGSPHEQLLEELNGEAFLSLLREVTGMANIVKADGQATLYAPGNFLWPHNDSEEARGRRVAYVLNLTATDWAPQWGGYLNFFDTDWNMREALRPSFNTLNLFAVPQWHSVSEVTSSAPIARFSVTGWGRNL
jgi:Rps23 Pro-64 3,4-dihydroxylase Tpa1-like proline 4-hydroxylase